MSKTFTYFSIVVWALLACFTGYAQTQLEMGVNGYPSPPNGARIAAITAELQKTTTGSTFVTYTPTITVSAAWSDQQYTTVTGMPVGTGTGSSFGTELNLAAKTALSNPVFDNIGSKSIPSPALFTSSPFGTAGTGIDTANNFGFNCFTTAEPLYAAASPTNGRYYYSTLTLTFSRAVDNPVLQIAGLGSVSGSLGFTTELELQTTGVTLDRLSGTGVFNIIANKILNSGTSINSTSGSSSATTGAASGSVRVTGTGITSLAFKVYLRGDGGGAQWSNAGSWAGDRWLLGVSMSTPVITGTIFQDRNGLQGTPFNTVDGTPTSVGGQLFANLVDAGGNVVLCNAVEPDGSYFFQDLLPSGYPAHYSIILSNTMGIVGDAAPAPALPSGWINTGEFLGAGAGNDGTVNGILPGVTMANASTVKVNANFGIEQLPNTAPKLKTYPNNTQGALYAVPGLTGTDPEDGALGTGSTFVVNTLPVGATLFYGGVPVTATQTISNFTPAQLTVDPLDPTLTTSFTYASVDAALQVDQSPATVTLNWSVVLPITLLDFTVTKSQQTTLLKWTLGEQVNTSYVEIERSANAGNFSAIKKFEAGGNSSIASSYSFTDGMPLMAKNYYRLKFVNNDGSIQYSQVRMVSFERTNAIITYPNPVQTELKISLVQNWLNRPAVIELFNQLGEKVFSKKITALRQTESIDLHLLPAGSYILKLTDQDNVALYKNIQIKR